MLHEHHQHLADARQQATTDEFDAVYRQYRPMVERTIAWLTKDGRRLHYHGIERNRLWWSTRCAAINIKRSLNLGLTYNNGWTTTHATAAA